MPAFTSYWWEERKMAKAKKAAKPAKKAAKPAKKAGGKAKR